MGRANFGDREQQCKHPPRWAQQFIEWYCKPDLAEDLIGDLDEFFYRNIESKGLFRARLIYIIDAFKFLRVYTVRAPRFVNTLINWIMLGSYVKTSVRNVARNKLFSTINIIGLAVFSETHERTHGHAHDHTHDHGHGHGHGHAHNRSKAVKKAAPPTEG